MRRKGRLCISRGLNHCEWREQSCGSAAVRSAAACVAVCVGEFVVAAHLALVRRVSRELGHERLLAQTPPSRQPRCCIVSTSTLKSRSWLRVVRETEEALPSQPSTESSETSETEGRTCLEVRCPDRRPRGGRRPHHIKSCGHFRRGASAGQRGARSEPSRHRRTDGSVRCDSAAGGRQNRPDSSAISYFPLSLR